MANEPMDPETKQRLNALKKRKRLGTSLEEILEKSEESEVLAKTLFTDTSLDDLDESNTDESNTSFDDLDELCKELASRMTRELDEIVEFGQAEEYAEGTSLMSTRVKSMKFMAMFEKVTCDQIKTINDWETLVKDEDIPRIAQELGLAGILEVVFWKWGSVYHYGPGENFPYTEFYLCKSGRVASIGRKILDWERDYGFSRIDAGSPPGDVAERKKTKQAREEFIDMASQYGVNVRSRKRS